PNGQCLASSSEDRTVIKVWDAQKDQESVTLPARGTLSPDWRRLASTAADNTVVIRDAQTGQPNLTLKGHTGPVRSEAFSPDGNRLASAGGREVRVWDAQTGQELLSLKGEGGGVVGVAYSPDGKRLAGASWYKSVKVWDAQTGQELLSLAGAGGN